jgi:hypothetical protein
MPNPPPPQLWRYVVLLHGVRSVGEWYPYATTVLAPHFVVDRPTYPGYASERTGLLATVIEPWLALATALGTGAALAIGAAGVAATAGATTAVLARRLRRNKALVRVRTSIANAQVPGDPGDDSEFRRSPHILAHSFGTYLAWHALSSDTTLVAGSVVFVGTPLRCALPWTAVRARIQALHNMIGRDDPLTKGLHGLVEGRLGPSRRVLPPLIGGAGHSGFVAVSGELEPGDVHTVNVGGIADIDWLCTDCSPGSRAWLHNWSSPADHSDRLQRRDWYAFVVRPLLWGMPPAEYRLFLRDCERVDIRSLEYDHVQLMIDAPLADLLTTPRLFLPMGSIELELLASLRRTDSRLQDPFTRKRRLRELGLALAARMQAAIGVDELAWRTAVDEIAHGVWNPPAPPDSSDPRFPLNPDRAIEELVEAVRSGQL